MSIFLTDRRTLTHSEIIRGAKISSSYEGAGAKIEKSAGTGIDKITLYGNMEGTSVNSSLLYAGRDGIKISTGSQNLINYQIKESSISSTSTASSLASVKFVMREGARYSLSFDFEFTDGDYSEASFDIGRGESWYQADIRQGVKFPEGKSGRFYATFQAPASLGERKNLFFRLRTQKGFGYSVQLTRFTLTEGTEGKEYIEYFEPSEATVSAELLSLGGVCDRLIIDRGRKRVYKEERIGLYTFTGGESLVKEEYNGKECFSMELFPGIADGGVSLCSHLGKLGQGEGPSYEISDRVRFFDTGHDMVSLFKTYLLGQSTSGTPVQIAYVKKEPSTVEIKDKSTLDALLSLGIPYGKSGILRVESKVDISKIDITYATKEGEDKSRLTLTYENEGGETIKESSAYEVRRGSAYTVFYPHIDGYLPEKRVKIGVIEDNCEIVLKYRSVV